MRIISKFIAMAALALFGLSQQASAAVLYDNGPIQGFPCLIYSVYSCGDSFTLSTPSIVTGVNFNVWFIPGDTLISVDFGITNTPYTYADNGTASVTLVPNLTSPPDFPVQNGASAGGTASFSTGSIPLAAGTYYLVLSNAVDAFSTIFYWDANHGASLDISAPTAGQSMSPAGTNLWIEFVPNNRQRRHPATLNLVDAPQRLRRSWRLCLSWDEEKLRCHCRRLIKIAARISERPPQPGLIALISHRVRQLLTPARFVPAPLIRRVGSAY